MAVHRTTRQKLAIFRACFTGRADAYGTYDPKTGKVRQVKQPVTDRILLGHLTGRQPYGVYLLVSDRTRAVAADFDDGDADPPVRFLRQARHYGVSAYLERSKSKGWHVWIFFPAAGVLASKARRVVQAILEDIGCPRVEVFPKQDCLTGSTRYGNFINAPLFGSLVSQGRTVFVDPDAGLDPYPDQWEVLDNVRRAPESLLDDLIEINDLAVPPTPARDEGQPDPPGPGAVTFGLPPCAQRMLAEGVDEYQRVACFRLAVHLKKAGLPQDLAVAALETWSTRNRPKRGRDIISAAEVREQTRCAYGRAYRGCGCEDPAVGPYCSPTCPLWAGASVRRQGETKPPLPKAAEAAQSLPPE